MTEPVSRHVALSFPSPVQGVGAICSRRAAELYGLDVLEEGIQDVKDNVTRFIVLSRWAGRKLGRCGEGWTRSDLFDF